MIESYKEVCSKQKPSCAFLEGQSRTIDLFMTKNEIKDLAKDYAVFHVHGKRFPYGKIIILVFHQNYWHNLSDTTKEEIIKAFSAEAEVLPLHITEEQIDEVLNKEPYTIRFRCVFHHSLIIYISRIKYAGSDLF